MDIEDIKKEVENHRTNQQGKIGYYVDKTIDGILINLDLLKRLIEGDK